VSAIDAPPGIPYAGRAAGEFVARPRARRLARRVFVLVFVAGALTLMLASRRLYQPMVEFLLVAPLMCTAIAGVGYAVRSAHLRIDRDGVRWGWSFGGFRLTRERLKSVVAYEDAVALQPVRGSTWYLSRRDWDRFERVLGAIEGARIPFEQHQRRAPLAARLQSYGAVLDGLLIADALGAMLALGSALLI
jgi:hypothetical protein